LGIEEHLIGVANNPRPSKIANAIDDFGGAGSCIGQVAAMKNQIGSGLAQIGQDCFESGTVAVDVGEDGDTRGVARRGNSMIALESGNNVKMSPRSKYARIERERRFLLDRFPDSPKAVRVRRITDRYIEGTRLRLREQRDEAGTVTFKLTQKLPSPGKEARQGLITTMYLTAGEFAVFEQLPAKKLVKTRYSLPPFGIDVFDGRLQGLILAEAEFDSAAAARSLVLSSFAAREVSGDHRFTGGRLACASRGDLRKWLSEFDIPLVSRSR